MNGLRGSPPLTHSSVALRASLQFYLNHLSETVPSSTFQSEKSNLSTYFRWHSEHSISECGSGKEIAVRFVRFLQSELDLAATTIRGQISTLVNSFAYHFGRDPELLTLEIGSALLDVPDPEIRSLGDRLVSDLQAGNCSELTTQVPQLVANLQQSNYATRTQVFAELLLNLRSRPEQIRQIDLCDIDIDGGNIVVGIPETHLVSSSGLLNERTVPLSVEVQDALETYIEYEREEAKTHERRPLLTTHNGRASQATLRRSLKRANETTRLDTDTQSREVLPEDIWRYALSTILTRR